MPRPRSRNPRSALVAFRITGDEKALLDAVAAVERTGANEAAHLALLRTLEIAKKDSLVQDQLKIHRRADQRSAAKIRSIQDAPRKRH